jgi:hypothetical protein
MQDSNQKSGKTDSGTAKDNQPGHVGGDHAQGAAMGRWLQSLERPDHQARQTESEFQRQELASGTGARSGRPDQWMRLGRVKRLSDQTGNIPLPSSKIFLVHLTLVDSRRRIQEQGSVGG